jgi:glycosyltransferase involved in cell wall biosynthesis
MKVKRRVLFVGAFKNKANDGAVGGQMYACKSLVTSELKDEIQWILLDTTGKSVPPPRLYLRMFFALERMLKFIFYCIYKRPHTVLIFSGNKPSIYEKGAMAILASFCGIGVILAPRGGPIAEEIQKSAFLRKFVGFVIRRSSYIVCQGIYWKLFFSSQFPVNPTEKFQVIPNWIDVDKYRRDISINQCSYELRVLFMAWMHKDKGLFDILDAIELMSISHKKKIKFVFLGDGMHKNEAIERARSIGDRYSFEFPGWVYDEEKINYIHRSDIFILPSYSEGLPNSLMEAMVCGVASIATKVGAIPDLITNNETGLLIDAGDSKALAHSLALLINDVELRQKLAKNGQERIIQNHSINSAVEKFKKIF